jgi:hypothetical protein
MAKSKKSESDNQEKSRVPKQRPKRKNKQTNRDYVDMYNDYKKTKD